MGPEHFGSEHLLDLRERLKGRLILFQRRQRLGLIIGGSASGWFLLAVAAKLLGYYWIAIVSFAASASGLVAFFWMIFRATRPFETKGSMEHDLRVIESELRRRAGKMPQQRF